MPDQSSVSYCLRHSESKISDFVKAKKKLCSERFPNKGCVSDLTESYGRECNLCSDTLLTLVKGRTPTGFRL